MTKKTIKKKKEDEDCLVCESDSGAAEILDIEAEIEDWDKDVVKREIS